MKFLNTLSLSFRVKILRERVEVIRTVETRTNNSNSRWQEEAQAKGTRCSFEWAQVTPHTRCRLKLLKLERITY